MNKMLIWAAIAVVIVGGTYLLITNLGTFSTADDAEQMMEEDDSITNDDTPSQEDFSGGMEEKGSYEVYAPEKLALANEGKAVLYFHEPCSSIPPEKSSWEGMEEKGSYEVYAPEKLALANEGKAVLYFHADW